MFFMTSLSPVPSIAQDFFSPPHSPSVEIAEKEVCHYAAIAGDFSSLANKNRRFSALQLNQTVLVWYRFGIGKKISPGRGDFWLRSGSLSGFSPKTTGAVPLARSRIVSKTFSRQPRAYV